MRILGIETSCDECAASVVEDGRRILSDVVRTQIPFHDKYKGVVPEIAGRKHVEWISGVVEQALAGAGIRADDVDGVAATSRPGLVGSLLVGVSFAKAMAWSLGTPFLGVNHILAHLYAPQLAGTVPYPFIGLLASGGHTLICRVDDFDTIGIMGTTIDDAAGEAFDKVAKYHEFGYPGGAAIDRLAEGGDENAFSFPMPSLHKGEHRYDVSYSGLKTAAIHQLPRYRRPGAAMTPENIAASFMKTAVDILVSRLLLAVADSGIPRVVAGGGVAANSRLRRILAARTDIQAVFPPPGLCGDNAAMVAGIACRYLGRGEVSPLSLSVHARVPLYRRLDRRI